MKKAIPIFFLAIFLLSTTQLRELLKLPLLYEHFQEHSKLNKNISIASFLKIHYAAPTTKDADYDKDMKLPFKSGNYIGSALAFYFNNFQFYSLSPKVQYTLSAKSFYTYQFFYSSAFLSSIWQPPKC